MLQVNNLSVKYGSIIALNNVSLQVNKNSIVTLIGANGAGKSTLLNTISNLIKLDSGTITFDKQDISNLAPEEIVKLGVIHVPEGRRIFSGMTVEENLLLGAYLRKDKDIEKDLENIYKRFEILGVRKNQKADTLSGGEQQMLAISRALLSKPRLLLLDEPSMGLAPLIVKQIFEIISEVNKEGITILLIEQNAHKALEVADYGYIIEGGKIMLEGDAKTLANSPAVKEIYLGKKGDNK